jgi:hypothetical protein
MVTIDDFSSKFQLNPLSYIHNRWKSQGIKTLSTDAIHMKGVHEMYLTYSPAEKYNLKLTLPNHEVHFYFT